MPRNLVLNDAAIWAVIPAAGIGARMGGDLPKQYLELCGRRVIEWAIEAFTTHPRVRGVVLSLAADDALWPAIATAASSRVITVVGGAERCHSVRSGLREVLRCEPDGAAWAMVHDAARPCLRHDDITALITAATADPVGAILALPVRDTMKRVGADGRIVATVERNGLWHALTPQMFRAGHLLAALDRAIDAGILVTDEAHAMEHAGGQPKVIEGRRDNIKITYPGDLALAEQALRAFREER